ncbi:MAG: hypothetical protein KY464_07010, partial [Gemmatimonadetes bacterium]|nr:hypothetical protein [Gemmatimonadota bacterium]
SALTVLWALIIGTGGILLVALWTLTDHQVAHRNENLFHFDPLTLGLILLLPAAAYGARWARRPAFLLAGAVAALSLLGFLLQPLPGLDQSNGEIIALILPVHVALAWAAYWIGNSDRGTGNRERIAKREEGRGKSLPDARKPA